MGKRNAYEVGQQNCGPNNKRTRFNGHSNDASFDDSVIECEQSPKPEFQLSRELVNGTILTDLTLKEWRIGKPIGKGSFGEIFLASDDISTPVSNENAKYVVKIEPHSNGPLFVEIHCLLNTAKNTEDAPLPLGMPEYIASGSHYFRNTRYRFLVLPRFDRDLHSIIKRRRVDQKSILILAVQILDILQHLHDKGYCHSDIKAENLMISKCTFRKSQLNTCNNTDSDDNDDNEDDDNDNDDDNDDDYTVDDEDNDDDDKDDEDSNYDAESTSSDLIYKTPKSNKNRIPVQYSGSNPVRSCRVKKRNSTYQEMVNSHYLRPPKKINYAEFFSDENSKSGSEDYTLDEFIHRQRLSNGHRVCNGQRVSNGYQKHDYNTNNKLVTEDRIFLIDFGLASKFIDSSGVHRPFCMDQRRAHDGTLEFTSRDAHMGAHSRRSDLECLGYNLIYWSQGYLPWKENAAQQQHEKVHWMKEYLMTDVKEMLKLVYGKSVPKYLGDFMYYVGNLAYHDRPNYMKCKNIFQREFLKMGFKKEQMILNLGELSKKPAKVKDGIENNNVFEMKNIKSIMKNLGVLLPFRESNSNRVSPKNLRSKSDKGPNSKRRKFSWAEILSQDPDQIARERAEKEFEREQTTETPIIRYSGKPTYAILEIQNRIKFKDRLESEADNDDEDVYIKGYTKPMMELLRKRQISLMNEIETHKKQSQINNKTSVTRLARSRAKSGLRTVITPTKRGLNYSQEMGQRRAKRSHKNSGDFTTDESSCSSLNSVASSTVNSKKSDFTNSTSSSIRGGGAGTSSCPSSGLSDDDSRDTMLAYSPKKTRHAVSANKIINNRSNEKQKSPKSIKRKRNLKGEIMRCV